MTINDHKQGLPHQELAFLKELEELCNEPIPVVEALSKKEIYTNREGKKEEKTFYQRGIVIMEGHVVGLSLRTHYILDIGDIRSLGKPISSLPASIGNLRELKHLDLFSDGSSSSIPPSIFSLTKLETLNLAGNALTSLNPAIENLSNLKTLILTTNKLEELPESLGNLKDLETLDLRGNQLTSLPKFISKLISLKKFDLGSNRLKTLPQALGKLINLEFLNLEFNNLQELPESFGDIERLEYLDLRENMISSFPESFEKLTKLKTLKLDSIETWPPGITNFKDLEVFRFMSTKISSIPEDIRSLTSLKELEMGLNLVTSIPSSIGELISLEHLLIVNSQIEFLPHTIGKLRNLEFLYLWDNKLKEIPPSIGDLENLKVLNLSSNRLSKLPETIGNLNNLEKLHLDRNNLTELPITFKNLKNVTELQLANNKFTELPLWLWKLPKLTKMFFFDDSNPWQGEWKEIITKDIVEIKEFCREKDTLKVFISHAVIDFESHKIKEISDFLETQDFIYQAYFCEEDLRGNIDEFMNLIVPQCQVLIFMGTKQSIFHSVDCKHEMELARKNGLKILPIKGHDVDWSDFDDIGINPELGIEFSKEHFDNFCKILLSKLKRIHETKEKKGISLEKTLEEIQHIIIDFLESSQFKKIYQTSQKEFESFKLELQGADMDPKDMLLKLSSLLTKGGGDI